MDRRKRQLPSTVTVTNFNLNSLIDQNNLSEDSCLVVVDNKVYDLTLWIQDHLSSASNQEDNRANSIYSDHSSCHPSPPPSPVITKDRHTQPSLPTQPNPLNQPNPFDTLLAQAKSDPVQAGNLLRSIYDREENLDSRLEDWIQEYRIGDFSSNPQPSTSFSNRIILPPFDNLAFLRPLTSDLTPTLHPSASSSSSSDPRSPPSLSNSFAKSNQALSSNSAYGSTDPSTTLRLYESGGGGGGGGGGGPSGQGNNNTASLEASSSSSMNQPVGGLPPPLEMARELVNRSKQQVIDAQRGVGIANLSLSEAWEQLARAEKLQQHLILQASEGFRPVWPDWEEPFHPGYHHDQ